MTDRNDPPPQVVRDTVRREHEAAILPYVRGGTPAAGSLTNLDPDTLRRNAGALPVLAAFQDFLEVERRRTRNRIAAVALLFLALLLAMGAVAGYFGLTYYRRADRQVTAMRSGVESVRTATEQLRAESRRELERLDRRAAELEAAITRDLGTRQDSTTALNTRVADMGGDVSRLQAMLAELEATQAEREALIRDQWTTLSNRLDAALALAARPAPPPPPATDPDRCVVLAILPDGGGTAVDWRIPLPGS
jgi:cell division protein FtsB